MADLNDRHAGRPGEANHIRRPLPAGEGDHEIGAAVTKHPSVADWPGRSTPTPVGREFHVFDAPAIGPLTRKTICARGAALDQGRKPVLGVQPVKFGLEEFSVAEIATTTDKHSHGLEYITPLRAEASLGS